MAERGQPTIPFGNQRVTVEQASHIRGGISVKDLVDTVQCFQLADAVFHHLSVKTGDVSDAADRDSTFCQRR
jgi:hypothetical protein